MWLMNESPLMCGPRQQRGSQIQTSSENFGIAGPNDTIPELLIQFVLVQE